MALSEAAVSTPPGALVVSISTMELPGVWRGGVTVLDRVGEGDMVGVTVAASEHRASSDKEYNRLRTIL